MTKLMDAYIKSREDVVSNVIRYESGQRGVQSRSAVWSRWAGTANGMKVYYNSHRFYGWCQASHISYMAP